MSASNGNGTRIHLLGQTAERKEEKRRAMNCTVGEVEDFAAQKFEEIHEFYKAQIPQIINAMMTGAFHAYDRGRRETFDEIMADFRLLFRREGGGEALMLDVTTELLLERLERVFGMPKPEPEAVTPLAEPIASGVDRAKEMGEG